MVLGLINVSLQRNNYRNSFFITQSRPQLYKTLSINQMIIRIIDNNGVVNKKKSCFFAKKLFKSLNLILRVQYAELVGDADF
jgi:hypothetical protein